MRDAAESRKTTFDLLLPRIAPPQDDGAKALAAALGAERCALTALDVASNAITADGAGALAGALGRGCPALGRLDVARNPLGAGGARALQDAARARGSLGRDTKLRC